MRRVILAAILSALPLAASAQDSDLRPLDRADEASQWWAVGRVNIGNLGYCTGTLIEVNVVLTAAHCFFDERTGQRYPDSAIRFVAGYKDGSAQSIRGAKKVVVDPDYIPVGPVTNRKISNDVALIELDQPILESIIEPIATGPRPGVGADVSIVSYGQGRDNRPSIQDVCEVTGTRSVDNQEYAIFALTCDITFGSSGSAVLDLSSGKPRVVSVISSMHVTRFSKTAYSMNLAESLRILRPQLSIGVQERKTLRPGEGGLPAVTSGLPQTAGGLGETRTGLPGEPGEPASNRLSLPQIGN